MQMQEKSTGLCDAVNAGTQEKVTGHQTVKCRSACTCEYCPTFSTGKHTLQMGTRCWHEIVNSAVVKYIWITLCIGIHLCISVIFKRTNNCARNFIFPSQNRVLILGSPSPTWIRQNTYLNIIIKISLFCGCYLAMCYVKRAYVFWCTRCTVKQ